MAITKLIVGGFKSLRDRVEIPLAPITLMFGPNSAGKSSVLHAMGALKDVLQARNLEENSLWGQRTEGLKFPSKSFEVAGADNDGPDYSETVLGVEFDASWWPGSIPLAREDRWNAVGLMVHKSLAEHRVTYEIRTHRWGPMASWTLRVDDAVVMSFTDALSLSASTEIPEFTDLWTGEPLAKSDGFGLLRVNVSWASALDPEMHELFRSLEVSSSSTDPWLRQAMWSAQGDLYVRVCAVDTPLQDWQTSFEDPHRRDWAFPDHLRVANDSLRGLLSVINEAVRQTEWSVIRGLSVEAVSGGRTLLTEADVSIQGLRTTYGQPHASATPLQVYAAWLALDQRKELRPSIPTIGDSQSLPQDDFVNAALRGGLFGARRYQVCADGHLTRKEWISGRPFFEGEVSQELTATLYLEDASGRILDFQDVGSGISYVLPVLVALWGADLSWIEQPELHLHPAAQCEMGDVIIRAFNRGRFSIIETHSEHLLLRILRRIRETSAGKGQDRELACQPEAVAVLYFAPQEDGSTQVHQLRVSRGGDFMDRWPEGFFEERSRELFDDE